MFSLQTNQFKKNILDNIFQIRIKYNYPKVNYYPLAIINNSSLSSVSTKKPKKLIKNQEAPVLQYKLKLLNDNKKVVINLIQNDSRNFLHISDRLKDDIDVVKEAMQQDGLLLEHAQPQFKNDPEIVELAMRNNPNALEHASSELKNDPYFIKLAKELKEKDELKPLNEEDEIYQKEKQFAIKILRTDGTLLRFANKKLRNDPEVVEEAVIQNGLALKYASQELRADKYIVLKAVSQYSGALMFANYKLKNDMDVQMAAVLNDPFHRNEVTPRFHIYRRPSPYPDPNDINNYMRSLY